MHMIVSTIIGFVMFMFIVLPTNTFKKKKKTNNNDNIDKENESYFVTEDKED